MSLQKYVDSFKKYVAQQELLTDQQMSQLNDQLCDLDKLRIYISLHIKPEIEKLSLNELNDKYIGFLPENIVLNDSQKNKLYRYLMAFCEFVN